MRLLRSLREALVLGSLVLKGGVVDLRAYLSLLVLQGLLFQVLLIHFVEESLLVDQAAGRIKILLVEAVFIHLFSEVLQLGVIAPAHVVIGCGGEWPLLRLLLLVVRLGRVEAVRCLPLLYSPAEQGVLPLLLLC